MGFFIDSLIGLVLLGLLIGVLLVHRRQRLLVDSLIALLLVGVLASVLMYRRNQKRTSSQHQVVRQALAVLQDQAAYRAAMGIAQTGVSAFPRGMSPLWFRTGLPINVTVPGYHPWLDVAPAGDMEMDPPDPVITHPRQAGIWYNPNQGIFRARVKDQGTDSATLALYSQLNETELEVLPKSDNLARRPLSLISVLLAAQAQAETVVSEKAKAQNDSEHTPPLASDRDAATIQATVLDIDPHR